MIRYKCGEYLSWPSDSQDRHPCTLESLERRGFVVFTRCNFHRCDISSYIFLQYFLSITNVLRRAPLRAVYSLIRSSVHPHIRQSFIRTSTVPRREIRYLDETMAEHTYSTYLTYPAFSPVLPALPVCPYRLSRLSGVSILSNCPIWITS
jgi:hypothetical protein